MTPKIDPAQVRRSLADVADWGAQELRALGLEVASSSNAVAPGEGNMAPIPKPGRKALADAVRSSARMLAAEVPGHSVELRVPPFVAVQCIDGPRHTRGTPPNVVELPVVIWLGLASGFVEYSQVGAFIEASGTRAGEIANALPVARIPLP